MHYRDLRDFIAQLQSQGELRRISAPVSPHLEMTALADRVLRCAGPAPWAWRACQRSAPLAKCWPR